MMWYSHGAVITRDIWHTRQSVLRHIAVTSLCNLWLLPFLLFSLLHLPFSPFPSSPFFHLIIYSLFVSRRAIGRGRVTTSVTYALTGIWIKLVSSLAVVWRLATVCRSARYTEISTFLCLLTFNGISQIIQHKSWLLWHANNDRDIVESLHFLFYLLSIFNPASVSNSIKEFR